MSLPPDINLAQLHHFFERSVDRFPNHLALICDDTFISYQELEIKANQLAHYLKAQGVGSGSTIAILLERSLASYLAILATLKLGAAYVPIDVDYPDERINYIFSDVVFDGVLTSAEQAGRSLKWPRVFTFENLNHALAAQSGARPSVPLNAQALCYVIYTSGSTGKPKGVEITHASICHYVKEASKIYEMHCEDRVYQGFSLAFDASLEELWMAWANGAALIASTSKELRSGLGLTSFLTHHQVSVFSTVPTLLSSLQGQLPHLRLLILGGEVCPQSLVATWSRPELRIINTYGPTEATVIATYAECVPGEAISIGKPLPGYETLVLNENLEEVKDGELGELCIGGVALARGYVNRPEGSVEKFILNPINPKQRLYRTGDRVTRAQDGSFYFAGRMDSQIKLRGFRIELDEIESVCLAYPAIKQAVVALHPQEPTSLVAYFLLEKNNSFDKVHLKHYLKANLPDYMVPAYLEEVQHFPVLASGKVDRKALPVPIGPQFSGEYIKPKTALGQQIASVWEEVFACAAISAKADFFYDLGGHSLIAAKVISKLRQIDALKNISILDLYKNPNIALLEEKYSVFQKHENTLKRPKLPKYRASQWQYYLCGFGQIFGCLFQYAVGTLQLLAVILGYSWLNSESAFISAQSQLLFLGLFFMLPIFSLLVTVGMKWLLLGKVKPGIYPLWGWFYYRWWLVHRLQKNLFLGKFLVGTPLAAFYYRMLGAKIGKDCYLGTMQIGTPDLLSMGDGCSLGVDSRLYGYVVEDGWLKIGSIRIGNQCYVGPRAVIGINTLLEDKSVLDEMSMLPEGSTMPCEAYYTGSPALSSFVPQNHITLKTQKQEDIKAHPILWSLIFYAGVVFVMGMAYLSLIPGIAFISHYYEQQRYVMTMFFALPIGAILFLACQYLSVIVCKKIILNRLQPGCYALQSSGYFRYWLITKMMDADEVSIMADTLYLPMFLRLLGAKLGKGVEMGEVPHIVPELVTIEEGGFTASSVALAWPLIHQGYAHFAPVSIGRRGFAGNVSLVSSGQTLGAGTLLGCLSVTPPHCEASQENTAWLGSPAVYLPKREIFAGFSEQETFYPPKKLVALRLSIEFIRLILPTTLSFFVLFNLLYVLDSLLEKAYSVAFMLLVLPVAELLLVIGCVSALVALKWLMLGRLKPLTKPIWDAFIWKNDIIEYSYNYFINIHLTNKLLGTPFVMWIPKALGSKVGKRVFTDSAEFSEFDLISIGDEVCINAETIIQTHLYEDRIFKVAAVTIGSGCNIGVGSIVLYNTLMEENATLGSLSLLMKGECLPANTQWAGIPAQSLALTYHYFMETKQDLVLEEVAEVS